MNRSARRALSALTALVMTGTLFVGAPAPTYANGSSVTYYVAQTGDPDGDGSSCTDPDFVGGDEAPIALAVDLATDGDTIYICAGTYLIEATIDLGAELLTLQGAGAGVTILDGGSDTLILDCTTATVSGLTFEDGRAYGFGEGGGEGPVDGGAISCTTVTVTNSTFIGNEAYDDGGAISGTTVTVTNSTFWNNNGGDGGAIAADGTVTVTNSTFIGNDANSFIGGAIAADGTVTVTNSTFIGNEALIVGGAIYGITITVTNSTFVGNSASYGGAISAATGIITQSRFRRNMASEIGGAVAFYTPNSDDLRKLRGNTFRLNAAPLGGAIFLNACETTVSRKKALRIERANLFLRNSATDQQRTKNIDRWSCFGA
jgi:predicted outer membrane repeat protein